MSKYTTEVRFIVENASGLTESSGYNSVDSLITSALPNIFNFTFPIFDETYRNVLLKKILKHYYTREIGYETVGLWKLKMDTKLNEIMPYYNKLYLSELIEINPLYTDSLTKTGETKRKETRESSGTGSATNTTRINGTTERDNVNTYTDTPSGDLNGILSLDYLTSASKDDETVTTSNTNTVNGSSTSSANEELNNEGDYLETVMGNTGKSQSELLNEYRKTFLNIDMQVIEELSDLFMNLW